MFSGHLSAFSIWKGFLAFEKGLTNWLLKAQWLISYKMREMVFGISCHLYQHNYI